MKVGCPKNPKNPISDPNFSGIQNSVSEKPDHDMGQTGPVQTRNSDILGILGFPELWKPHVDTLKSYNFCAKVWKGGGDL
jgi:hypothetical protein